MSDLVNFDDGDEQLPPAGQFVLGGRTWTVKNPEDVAFNLAYRVFTVSDDGKTWSTDVTMFFRGVLVADDVEPFLAMLAQPDSPLTERKVSQVVETVGEWVFTRPTTPPANSSRSRRRRSSAGGSSSPDTPRLASAG